MNKQILMKLGFDKEVNAIEELKCPFCKEVIDTEQFRDKESKLEFKISGLCQSCQDKVFGV